MLSDQKKAVSVLHHSNCVDVITIQEIHFVCDANNNGQADNNSTDDNNCSQCDSNLVKSSRNIWIYNTL